MARNRWRHHPPPILNGRDDERTRLREILDDAIAGHGSLVLISGEAGIGKTALIRDLVHEAGKLECLVLAGGCYDLATTPPYGPWTEMTRAYPDDDPELPQMPEQFQEGAGLEGIDSQDQLFELAVGFLQGIAYARPLLLVLEDLHWSDAASLDLLRVVARRIEDQRILIVASYRDDEIGSGNRLFELLPSLVRESRAARINLASLDNAVVQELIEHRYEIADSDARRLAVHVDERADGIPLFIEEILQELEDSGALAPADGSWQLGDLSASPVPSLLQPILENRLQRLSTGSRRLLQAAAVLGQEIRLSLWATVTGNDEDALITAMEEALGQRLIEDLPDVDLMRFRHALFREALYHDLSPLRRRRWHLRAAEQLIDSLNPDPDEIAHHFGQAADRRAADWLMRAGDRAARSYAWNIAVERFDEAQQALAADPGRTVERALVLSRGGFLSRYIDLEQSLAWLKEAERLARETEDKPLIAHTREYQIYPRYFLESLREVMSDQDEILAEIEGLTSEDYDASPSVRIVKATPWLIGGDSAYPPPHPGVAVMRGGVIAGYAQFGMFREAIEDGYAHLSRLDRLGVPPSERSAYLIDTCRALGISEALLGNADCALDHFRQARKAAQDWKHTASVAGTYVHILEDVLLPYRTDDRSMWRRVRSEADAVLNASQAAFGDDDVQTDRPHYVDFWFGNWNSVERAAQGQAEHATQFWRKLDGYITLARLARARGRVQEAWEYLETALPDGPSHAFEYGDIVCRFDVQRIAIDLALDNDDLDTARIWLEAYEHWLDWSGAVLGQAERDLLWARYHLVAGDLGEARKHADEALRHASDPRQPLALIAIYRLLGQMALRRDQLDEARHQLETSCALAHACETPYEQALTLLVIAELEIAMNDRAAAEEALATVRELCKPLEARVALNRADELEAVLADGPPREHHPAGLTPREVDVLRLVAQGMTDAETAEQLYLSPRTVSSYLSSVYNKLGVNSRTAASSWAVREGILD